MGSVAGALIFSRVCLGVDVVDDVDEDVGEDADVDNNDVVGEDTDVDGGD